MKLPAYLFWWEWVQKMLWDPFGWLILFSIILWVPFLRVWWWFFLPLLLQPQLKTLYRWWIAWDYDQVKAKWVVLEITPPKEVLMPFKAMEDVFSTLWPIWDFGNFRERWCDGELDNGPYWFSWEIASIEGKIHYYIRFLQQFRASVEAVLFAHFPDIEIKQVQDYTKLVSPTVPNEDWDLYGEDWVLIRPNYLPIKTYEKFFEPQGEKISAEEKRIDPILSLLEAMSKLGPGEHYWFQMITTPVKEEDEPEYRKDGEKAIHKIAQRPEKKEIGFFQELGNVFGQILTGPAKEGSGESAKYSWPAMEEDEETGELRVSLTPGERQIITEIDNKLSKPAYRTNIRGVYVAKRENWNPSHRILTRGYIGGHFALTDLNAFKFDTLTRPRIHYFMRKRRVFLRARRMFKFSVLRLPGLFPDRRTNSPIFCSEELATMWHFPVRTTGMVAPALKTIESKKGGPPPNLPVE